MIETAGDESPPGLGDVQGEGFHFGRLLGLVDRGPVFGHDLEFRSPATTGRSEAQVGDGEAALGGDHLALLEQVDLSLGTDGRASKVEGQQRGGHLEHSTVDAGNLIADPGLLLGRIEGPAQHHRSEGLTGLFEGEFELAEFGGRAVHREGCGKPARLFEGTRGRKKIGPQRPGNRSGHQFRSQTSLILPADLAIQGRSIGERQRQGRGQIQFGGGPIHHLVHRKVEPADLHFLGAALRGGRVHPERPVLYGDIADLQLQGFGRAGRGGGRSRG